MDELEEHELDTWRSKFIYLFFRNSFYVYIVPLLKLQSYIL